MSEFIRKKRFLNYKSRDCKKYLSKDFIKRCAYCQIREGDLGGPDDFEIDHFIPQDLGGSDSYKNLYYICSTCNGKAGKSDAWSKTLLDPCKDDINNVHIMIQPNFRIEDLTPQGAEYISTFKLNRKSYIQKRKKIYEHKKELRDKLGIYESWCEKAFKKNLIDSTLEKELKSDIIDIENIIEFGANYRMSLNCFDEEIDSLIFDALSRVGDTKYIDEDYDIFYQLRTHKGKVYKCQSIIDKITFNDDDLCLKYISMDKVAEWKRIEEVTPILIIYYNNMDGSLYYVRFSEILKCKGIDNQQKCGYHIHKKDLLGSLL